MGNRKRPDSRVLVLLVVVGFVMLVAPFLAGSKLAGDLMRTLGAAMMAAAITTYLLGGNKPVL